MTNEPRKCRNKACFCTGECMGIPKSGPAVYSLNPNRGGPIHSAPDTLRPRMPVRGRTDYDGAGTFKDRLQAQIEKPGREVSYCPEVRPKEVIEPSQELGRGWPLRYGAKGDGITDDTEAIKSMLDDCPYMKGLEFGGEHE